jgi:hypothetical protein
LTGTRSRGCSRRAEARLPKMADAPKDAAKAAGQRLTPAQVRFYAIGYAVLAAGSVCSYWAYRVALRDEMGDALMAQARNTKGYQGQMEFIGGKANILGSDITRWFVGLWHGRNLAYTLAVLTLACALLCFYIAFALPDLPPFGDEEPADGTGEKLRDQAGN